MAFKSEAEKKAYEADIACRLFVNNFKNAKPSIGKSTQRTDADRLMHYTDADSSNTLTAYASILGFLLMWVCPPIGIALFAIAIWSFIQFCISSAKADQR
jgi:hypothetical protein